jgi:cation/acetate symporter
MISLKNDKPNISEKNERAARGAAAVAVIIAGYFGINLLVCCRGRRTCFWISRCLIIPSYHSWDFDKKMNKEGAIAGMIIGRCFLYAEIQIWTLMVEKMLLLA